MDKNPRAQEEHRVLELAMDAGALLLQNGAEIFRVEETMQRICRHYGVNSGDFFVLSNGLFVTGCHGTPEPFARVEHLRIRGVQLDKVVAVNQLSREISDGRYTVEEAEQKLAEIRALPPKRAVFQYLASAVGAGCFCRLFGGGALDMLAAFLAGLLLHVYVLRISAPHLSKIVGSIFGGALVTAICIVCHSFGLGANLSAMIAGAIIPLVPGIAFTNGIRDIGDGNYIAGTVRLLDAILVFLCIAIGVGVVFTVYHRIMGGVLL